MRRAFPMSRVIVLPGDSYHIAAVEPDLCAQHALEFMQQAGAMRASGKGSRMTTRRAVIGGLVARGAALPARAHRAARLSDASPFASSCRLRRAAAPTSCRG